jgi:hypothetical protein
MMQISPLMRAWIVTIVFASIGAFSMLHLAPQSEVYWAHVLFYSVITLNTFFSVRLFARIQPENISQLLIDLVLVACYVALALSIGHPLAFAAAALGIFIAAPIKYILMRGLVPYPALLARKITIDLLGTALCASVLGAALLGYEVEAAWVFGAVFALANVYLLAIKPMYRL